MTATSTTLKDSGNSPFTIEFLMVLCSGLRHMAFRDDAGTWRDAYDRSELRGPVKVLG